MRTKGPGEAGELLLDVVAVLTGAGVAYAVVGAMAAAVHGVIRASVDADVVLATDLARLRELENEFCGRRLCDAAPGGRS